MKRTLNKNNGGVALILTLLFVVLLTVLVVEFAYEAQVEASYALNAGNEFHAQLAARSAVYNGIAILESDRLETELAASEGAVYADSRQSSWALPSDFEPLNDAVMRTTITDEFGKINLNALLYYNDGGEPILREHIWEALVYFFQTRDEGVDAVAIVDSIRDWIDDDDDVEGDGAESDFYQKAENPYPSKNGPMDSIEELLLIKGVSTDLYFGKQGMEPIQLPLSEYLTVHGDWLGRINPNTVYVDYDSVISEVLEAMNQGWSATGMGEVTDVGDLLDVVIDVETGQPFNEVSEIMQYVDFSNLNTAQPADPSAPIPQPRPNSQPQGQAVNRQGNPEDAAIRRMFTVYSHIFRIQGDALLDDILVRNEAYVYRVPQDDNTFELPQDNGADTVRLNEALIQNRPDEFYRILEWKVIQ